MLSFPGKLSARQFLQKHWQKKPLFMRGALDGLRPALTRNELGWLATLEDVESRIVFVDRNSTPTHYRAETGPFALETLRNLPKRDWTLLVHDVEKHVPKLRQLLANIAFIPDWRIDDLMVSFAAPGGGVGPHMDNYDVFLCQGIGTRNWRYSSAEIARDAAASEDLALLAEFTAEETHDAIAGDVLYLPPGTAHWGTASRACMTYSIGMRAPQISDLVASVTGLDANNDKFYTDADLTLEEAIPGYISPTAGRRVADLVNLRLTGTPGEALGRFATQTKGWLAPQLVTVPDSRQISRKAASLELHGMTRIAFDDDNLYVNGRHRAITRALTPTVAKLCATRTLTHKEVQQLRRDRDGNDWLRWLLVRGAFDVPANLRPYVK